MKIPELFLRRPVGTIMLWTGLITGGIWTLFNIRTDFLPDFSVPRLTVISTYQGLPADEIRRLITIPLEDSLSSLGGLRRIKSISRDGLSLIELEFPWGTDRTEAGLETRGVIDLAWHNLPSDASKPRVLAVDPGDQPIITLGIFPKNGSLSLARRIADRELRSRLQRIEGVGSIQLSGGLTDEVKVEVDPKRLAGLGYTLPALASALEGANIDYPAGTITEGNTEYLVKTRSRAQSLMELGGIFLPKQNGDSSSATIRLRDVASIEMGQKEQSSVFFSASGSGIREGVRLQIRRTAGFSPAAMAENIRRELEEISRSFGRDLDIYIISDRSLSLKQSMHDLAFSLLSGAVFAFVIILLFMRNLPRALLLLISLPSSLLLSVLMLFLTGKSLNLMSLGGLALGVGMVVDNSIVVTERMSRLGLSSQEPEARIALVSQALRELAPSLAGSTLTTVIVFLPLLFIRGLTGSLFADLGLSVIFALISSLLLALSFIPVLYLVLNPKDINDIKNRGNPRPIIRLVKTGMKHPAIAGLIALLCCAAAVIPFPELPLEVITPINEGIIRGSLKLPPGTSIKSVRLTAEELAGEISTISGVEHVNAWAGGESSDPYYLASTDESSGIIQLEINHRKNADTAFIKKRLSSLTAPETGTLNTGPPENILANLLGINVNSDWVISGDKPGIVRRSAEEAVRGLADVRLVPEDRKTRILVYPDRKALSSYGIGLSDLSEHIGQAVYGEIPTNILINGEETDVRLRIMESERSERGDILQLNMPGQGSAPVRLSSIVRIQDEQALPYLLREGRKDLAVIRTPSDTGRNITSLLKSRGAEPRDVPVLMSQLPQIIRTLILAVILLYLCLGIQFESFFLPLLLMLSIPAGASGIIAILFLTGHSLNLNSSLGILVVMGISVNNGILLFEEASRLMKQSGALPLGAIYRGTISRLRPILMTSLTTITALIPLAIDPFGTSSQASLAVSIIGGLVVSTLMSLLVLPNIIKTRLKGRPG